MTDCEMCGKKNISPVRTKIEGTLMSVCDPCSSYGEKISTPKKVPTSFIMKNEKVDPDLEKMVVPNFALLVKSAREQKNLKQEQVAKKISEKESLIHNIESGKFKPSFKTARKLEKFYGISLIEDMPKKVSVEQTNIGESLTMGDILEKALKKD